MKYLAILLLFAGCANPGSAPKLQNNLAGAKTSTAATGNSIERIDFKAGRALKVLNEGFAK